MPEVVKESSAGIIPYRSTTDTSREYLLLKYENGGHWGFPKGHIEEGESTRQAALREFQEETSCTVEFLHPHFTEIQEYTYQRESIRHAKQVYYFLGKISDGCEVSLSSEHVDFRWCPYGRARDRLTYPGTKRIIRLAEGKLKE